MNEQEFAELAAGYALHALTPQDRAAFDAARAAHPEWEHWIETDAETAAALGYAVADALPPLTMRSSLLSQISAMPQLPDLDAAAAAEAAPRERWVEPEPEEPDAPFVEPAPTTTTIQAVERRNWTRGLLALAASVALLVVLGFGAATVNEYVNRPPEVVALQQIEDAPDSQTATAQLTDGGTATAHWSASVGQAVLVTTGLPALADDQSFEMWFVRDGQAVSAGTFEPRAGGETTALLDGTVQEGDTIAVTVEPVGGAPDGQPTSDPIVAIPTA
ncbi:anti-sigma factor [Microbacterium sp. M3]|uniref:Regulator of SigK n=1 Tax=Microbacterium arthrosphaerae TaxID=792652 RepID=A0ABU4GYG2_9MICO|nr:MULTISPECIES: anti-sigma factor [Microbacterium]MDW4571499.1 anti-sigma factor [Microbacterium arthrosphaerae]MDW7605354.1 anti-sigma factor [Microbacterium sp. M3]